MAAAAVGTPTNLFGQHDCGARAHEEVDDDVALDRAIAQRVGNGGDGLDRRVQS